VAKVLGVTAYPKGFSPISTNADVVVDLAVVNRGNQNEIIREAFLCYAETANFNSGGASWSRDTPPLNIQLAKGDKRVVRLSNVFNSLNTGKRLWLGVALRAVGPNADDLEITWPICEINLATDGNGGSVSYNKDQTPQIQILSNTRLPHQRLAPDGL
jgi:hypothetical protein